LWNNELLLLTSSRLKMTFKKALRGFENKMFDYWGAYYNNELVGFMLLKQNKDLFIKHIAVEEKFRREKLGTKFLKKAEKIAKKRRLNLKAEVLEKNKKTKEFFLKNNFKLTKLNHKENQYIFEKKL